ncbi:MAG: hypothetical protein LRY44_02685 [Candidatus Pacebacteria bacterium]|nr:hypothetical protein [Candidatus Paceibacterota bacterium]MCD8563897.1 hypothetical protein [Candidatus Paceibacterota bacterium]
MSEEEKKFNNLDAFLEKFRHIVPREILVKESFTQVFYEVFDIPLHKDHIEIRGKVIFLTISPLMKQEILYKKEILLEKMRDKTNGVFVEDIR